MVLADAADSKLRRSLPRQASQRLRAKGRITIVHRMNMISGIIGDGLIGGCSAIARHFICGRLEQVSADIQGGVKCPGQGRADARIRPAGVKSPRGIGGARRWQRDIGEAYGPATRLPSMHRSTQWTRRVHSPGLCRSAPSPADAACEDGRENRKPHQPGGRCGS